jgi:serine/threonine protein kinase
VRFPAASRMKQLLTRSARMRSKQTGTHDGRTLAHYHVLAKIGSGGMGDVYLAQDLALNREIALKVLPPELAESEERRARFEREAKAVAALNHPDIVTIHSVEQVDGVHFITMELVIQTILMLARGVERGDSRDRVRADIDRVLSRWRKG